MKKIVIFGNRDFAELAHFYFGYDSSYEVVAFTMDSSYIKESKFKNLPIVPFETIENEFSPNEYGLFIPMSFAKMNEYRKEKYYAGKKKGYTLVNYISSKATYYNTPVGDNCFIFESNVIQPFTKIGSNVILWSGNHIGHHSTIEDHVFVSSHVVVSGHCQVGEGSFLGVNSTISNNVSIAKYNLVGPGAIITKNTEENSVYKGSRSEKAPYLSYESKGI
ncbi:MAG: acetyltransferase [Bdellovibrionaceae bacterium]|nr:acetyltransferase [Pseudobdellovibrionaceae bacterium]